jgi:hypothetical protein
MTTYNEQIINQPALYINGLQLSNDATTPNTKLDVAAGVCRDSTNTVDINVGNYLGANPNLSANTATVINTAVVGANGIDTGTLAASTIYYVFAIADVTNNPLRPPACIISTSATPLLPTGYGYYRRIGWAATDGSTHFAVFYQDGNGSVRNYWIDVPVKVLNAGTSTSFAAVDLTSGYMPPIATNVFLQSDFTPNTAGDAAAFRPTGSASTNGMLQVTGVVSAKVQSVEIELPCLLASSLPKVDYKVAASGSLSLWVVGFQDNL